MLAYETFSWFNKLGIKNIHKKLTQLSNQILTLLQQKQYTLPIQYAKNHSTAILCFQHPNPKKFMSQLKKHNGTATYRDNYIRLSPGIYQNQTTIKKLNLLL